MERQDLKAEQAKWEKILANEGMPSEVSAETEIEHSEAFDHAVSGLYRHYVTTATDNWGVHREALGALIEDLKAAGGAAEEIAELDEDFARQIEDEVTRIQQSAVSHAAALVRKTPKITERPNAFSKQVVTFLRAEHPEIDKDVLEILADNAVRAIH